MEVREEPPYKHERRNFTNRGGGGRDKGGKTGRVRRGGPWECVVCHEQHKPSVKTCDRCGALRATVDETRLCLELKPEEAVTHDDAFYGRVRLLLAPKWTQLRLLWVGAKDPNSPLARLPMEIIALIGRHTGGLRRTCWADSRLRWFRDRAAASSTGMVHVRLTNTHIMCYGDVFKEGLDIEYRRDTQRFTIFKWRSSHPKRRDYTFCGFWSHAVFLAHASFEPEWRSWIEQVHD